MRVTWKPAWLLVLAMGQFGPAYATEGWGRLIDPFLRGAVAMGLVMWALRLLLAATEGETKRGGV